MQKSYKKLFVWQKADEFARKIYVVSKKFPREEMYGVTSQLRRSALSVPTNIVEGNGRHGKAEKKQFVNIALGLMAEAEYLLEFCFNLGYLDEITFNELETLRQTTGAVLWKFYKSF